MSWQSRLRRAWAAFWTPGPSDPSPCDEVTARRQENLPGGAVTPPEEREQVRQATKKVRELKESLELEVRAIEWEAEVRRARLG